MKISIPEMNQVITMDSKQAAQDIRLKGHQLPNGDWQLEGKMDEKGNFIHDVEEVE